jgi:hypothetical protein
MKFYKASIEKQYLMTCGFMYAYDVTKEDSLSALLPLLDILKEVRLFIYLNE